VAKLLLSLIVLGVSTFTVTTETEAFKNSYRCTSVVETTVGYDPHSDKIESNTGPVKNPSTVSLSGVKSDRPVLGAQKTIFLNKLIEGSGVISLAEMTSGGTIVTWVLFEKDGTRPPTLISTKSYNLAGAVSFTAFYKCK